jgi:hypothetical protein
MVMCPATVTEYSRLVMPAPSKLHSKYPVDWIAICKDNKLSHHRLRQCGTIIRYTHIYVVMLVKMDSTFSYLIFVPPLL